MFVNFQVKNFRCFQDFTIEGLQRVNLVVGMNDTGKTALLEAIYFLLGETNLGLVLNVNSFRGIDKVAGDMNAVSEWLCKPLFYDFDTKRQVEIGGGWDDNCIRQLRMKYVARAALELPLDSKKAQELTGSLDRLGSNALEIQYLAGKETRVAKLLMDERGIRVDPAPPAPGISGYYLAARTTANHEEDAKNLGQLQVEKTSYDLLTPLKIIEPRLTRLQTILGAGGTLIYGDIGLSQMMPLGLLGDGLVRLTSILVKVATAKGGVVLVDDVDSGMHHTVLQKMWAAIGAAARQFDVQVIATTHSYECIRAAHEAFTACGTYDLRLFRLERINARAAVAAYDQEMLGYATEMSHEVR
jgi:hypothetical protein